MFLFVLCLFDPSALDVFDLMWSGNLWARNTSGCTLDPDRMQAGNMSGYMLTMYACTSLDQMENALNYGFCPFKFLQNVPCGHFLGTRRWTLTEFILLDSI